MTMGVPVAVDPDPLAAAAGAAGLVADVPAVLVPAVVLLPVLVLLPLLLQAAMPPASASARNAVVIGLCLIPVLLENAVRTGRRSAPRQVRPRGRRRRSCPG